MKFSMPKLVQDKILPQLLADALKAKRSWIGIAIISKDGSVKSMRKWLNKNLRNQIINGGYEHLFHGINSLNENKKYKVNVFSESRMMKDVTSQMTVPCQVILIEE